MKQLELELNKRLLIVEVDKMMPKYKTENWYQERLSKGLKLICKGSEFTEEISTKLVNNFLSEMSIEAFENYNVSEVDLEKDHWAGVASTALESFISAIESQGYYWGENPIEKPLKDSNFYFSEMTNYHEAESKTFNLEKTLIFEIL